MLSLSPSNKKSQQLLKSIFITTGRAAGGLNRKAFNTRRRRVRGRKGGISENRLALQHLSLCVFDPLAADKQTTVWPWWASIGSRGQTTESLWWVQGHEKRNHPEGRLTVHSDVSGSVSQSTATVCDTLHSSRKIHGYKYIYSRATRIN